MLPGEQEQQQRHRRTLGRMSEQLSCKLLARQN